MAKITLKNLMSRVDLKSEFNFETFTGIALDAIEKEGEGRMGFQFNVKYNSDPEIMNVIIQNMLDNLAYPEIMHRVYSGKLSPTYKASLIHILLYTKHSKNKVLLGNETQFSANFILKQDRQIKNSEKINFNEVKEITKIFPKENYCGDAAHIMLVKFKNKWVGGIDLVFDRLKIKTKMNSAKDFLDTAQSCLEEEKWAPFISNIYRAYELGALSSLLFIYQGNYSTRQDHKETLKRFKGFCKNYHAPSEYSEYFEKISSEIKSANYGTGVVTEHYTFDRPLAEKYLSTGYGLIDFINKILENIDNNRKSSGKNSMEFRLN